MDRAAFFRALFGDCDGLVEFRLLPGGMSEFWPVHLGDTPVPVDRFCQAHAARNIYFGVGTRDGDGGGKQNLVMLPAVWADVDFKDTPPQRIKENIPRFPFRPSAAIHSGGGFHLYWMLREPAGREHIPMVEGVNRRIAAALGGDMNSVDAARILRVPGTTNHKRGRTVTIRHLADFRYDLDDFLVLPEPERHAPSTGGGAAPGGPGFEIDRRRLLAVFKCRFLQHAYESQATLSEPLWYAALSNVCRLSPGGVSLAHEFSRRHPGYSQEDCTRKILHAMDAARPHSCIYIKSHGFNACGNCDAKSPLSLVLSALTRGK